MEITFQWIGGATFILHTADLRIAVDPVLCEKGTVQDYFWFKSKRIEEPVYGEEDFKNIDLWLITHNHEDHIDEKGLTQIADASPIISNQNSVKKLKASGKKNINTLEWGQKKVLSLKGFQIEVEAIPAIHGVNPLSAFFAGKVNGYYLSISNEREDVKIYITSDTVYKQKVIKALKDKEIDLLIPNMGAAKQGSWIMTLTLNSKMLKKMITRLRPKIVIPVHYGTFAHYKEPATTIRAIQDERIKPVEVGSKTVLSL